VHGYFFHAWSAKALVVLSLAALFNIVEKGSHWLVAFGVAALAQLLKPPLSLLLPFYLLAALPLCLWLSPRENRRRMTWTFVALLAGSIAAQLVWHAVLHRQSKTDMYDLSGQTMAAFNPHIVLTRLLPYLASEYTPHLLAFVVTVLMGLLWPRQFAFPLLMVAFMSATILGIFFDGNIHSTRLSGGRALFVSRFLRMAVLFSVQETGGFKPMYQNTKIALVIPCFHCAGQILDVTRRVPSFVDALYVVDDACPEQSGALVKKEIHDPRVRVLTHEHNQGVGGAMISGYRAALADGCDILIKIDGDGQMNTDFLPLFITPLIENRADYVKGNRFFLMATP
jgi:hypothetical protein